MRPVHLSIVAVGRNDDYGGDFRQRLQDFVSWTHQQLTTERIPSEIIFVNYNPVPSELIDAFIDWPASNESVTVRIMTVPSEVHQKFIKERKVKNVPVLEYLAKNIGIRRANGRFILAMNPDILIHHRLFRALRNLNKGSYYRVNRVDYAGEFDRFSGQHPSVQLRDEATRIWFKGSHTDVSRFRMAEYLHLWFRKETQNFWRRNTVKVEQLLNRLSSPVYYHNIEYRFHCNASGDFMLMHRDHWSQLNGYDESSFISLHVDSLMVIQAAFAGLRERVFRFPVFHRQHDRRYDAVSKTSVDQDRAYQRYKRDTETMQRTAGPIVYNDQDWGLVDTEMPEITP